MNVIEWLGYMAKGTEVSSEILKKFRKLYNEKKSAGQCLWRDDETGECCTDKRAKGRRGRCMKHYRVWLRDRIVEQARGKLATYEAYLIQTAQLENDEQGERSDLLEVAVAHA